MLYITNSALDTIERDIARYQPERGGALLGRPGQPIITHFVLDSQAITSGASYLPSARLTEEVQYLERTQNLEFKGVIHSHPGSLDRPSYADEEAILEGLNINPHLQYFVAPIITLTRPNRCLEHELKLSNAKMSCYIGYTQGNRVRIESVQVREVSEQELNQLYPNRSINQPTSSSNILFEIKQELEKISRYLGVYETPNVFFTNVEGCNIPAGQFTFPNQTELLFLFSTSHPIHAPRLLKTILGKDTQEITLAWSMSIPANKRLLTAIKSIEEIIKSEDLVSEEQQETVGKSSSVDVQEEKTEVGLSESSESSLARA